MKIRHCNMFAYRLQTEASFTIPLTFVIYLYILMYQDDVYAFTYQDQTVLHILRGSVIFGTL